MALVVRQGELSLARIRVQENTKPPSPGRGDQDEGREQEKRMERREQNEEVAGGGARDFVLCTREKFAQLSRNSQGAGYYLENGGQSGRRSGLAETESCDTGI